MMAIYPDISEIAFNLYPRRTEGRKGGGTEEAEPCTFCDKFVTSDSDDSQEKHAKMSYVRKSKFSVKCNKPRKISSTLGHVDHADIEH
jgi:hypothetical protein